MLEGETHASFLHLVLVHRKNKGVKKESTLQNVRAERLQPCKNIITGTGEERIPLKHKKSDFGTTLEWDGIDIAVTIQHIYFFFFFPLLIKVCRS